MLRTALATLAALAVGLTLAPGAQPLSPATTAIEGTWTGTLTQRMTAPFTVTATIRSFNRYAARNSVRYGAPLNCRGHWRYLGRKKTAWRFRETITGGEGATCKGSGTVTLTATGDEDTLRYRFTGGGVTSSGTIRRR